MALAVPMLSVLVSFILLLAMFFAMLLGIRLLMRNIDIVVPFILYEIDRMAAGVVLAAVLAPVLRMAGRHMHINWLINDTDRYGMNHHRSCVDEFRLGKTADVNAAVKARLVDTDRDSNVGAKCS